MQERKRKDPGLAKARMYEAINLARQIVDSLVRSQANCWDALECPDLKGGVEED